MTDQSPGAKDTPAISDESMTLWMQYIYQQQALPTNASGVHVSIDAVDSNNNFVHLGDAISDIDGHYGFTWNTPAISGQYRIIASFEGSNSYYSSHDVTYAAIIEPTATTTPQPTQTPSTADLYFLPMSAAIIVLIIIVGVATILMMRKRP